MLPQSPVMPPEVMTPVPQAMQPDPYMVQRGTAGAPAAMQGEAVQQAPMAMQPVFTSGPVSTAQVPVAPQTVTMSPQTFPAPQVFASAPVPVVSQNPAGSQPPYTAQQGFAEAGSVSGSGSPLPPGAISFTQETDLQGRNYNDRILEMYKEGKSKVAIARELNLGVGEVKLVIDLYKNRSEK